MAIREEKAVKKAHRKVMDLYRKLDQANGPKEEMEIEKKLLAAMTAEDITERKLRRALKMSA